ncbi:uncharacterized protein LOC135824427 [Sycon ciliatum]|uniref:uncharacterized protein LOC135824427 n=1 Tax=Sycon ciliatum TaxID=27933 RepID=UPI0031F6C7CC
MVLQFKMSIHTVLSLVICYYVLTGTTVMSCPASCTCSGAPRDVLDCQFRGLTMVPGGIPNTTIVLLLSNNQIQTLSDGVFSNLPNLYQLGLTNNQIPALSDGVFSGLTNLQYPDLRNNRIQTLGDGVFSGLTNLKSLYLSSNPLILKPSLYVNLHGILPISSNFCFGCVLLDSRVVVYLNQVSKSCAPGHFQKFNNKGSADYYCRCNESVPVIAPNCSSPGYTCLANGQFPICFGYTQCKKAGSTYICTCEKELSLHQSYCYIAEDCQNTVEDCGNGNCTMDYPPESRINSEFNEPSNPLGGAYSTINVTIHGGNIVIQCQPYFDLNIDAVSSTVQCLSYGNWTTLRATPCSRASVAPLTTGKPTTTLIPTTQRTMSTTVAPATTTPTTTSASPTTSGITSGTLGITSGIPTTSGASTTSTPTTTSGISSGTSESWSKVSLTISKSSSKAGFPEVDSGTDPNQSSK